MTFFVKMNTLQMKDVHMQPMLTIEELAEALRVSTRTIYRMIDNGELPFAIKVQGSWRFREEDVKQWLESLKLGCKK